MADLVDYLRDKLDHADDVVCICVYVDFPAGRFLWDYVKGCPVHEEQRIEALRAAGTLLKRATPLPPDPPPKRKRWWRR